MSIFDPESSSVFGALDSTAIADGTACHAHLQRHVIMSSNRIAIRGEELFNRLWSSRPQSGSEDSDDNFSIGFYQRWSPINLPIRVLKKPGLNRLNVHIYIKVPSSVDVQIQISTQASPYSASQPRNVIDYTGTGSFEWVNYDGCPLSPGTMDLVSLHGRSVTAGALGTTGTYGSPNSGSLNQASGDSFEPGVLIDASAVWFSNPSWADAGHVILFKDRNGAVMATRTITGLAGATKLYWAPVLDQGSNGYSGEFRRIKPEILGLVSAGAGSYEIRKGVTKVSIGNIMGYAPDLVI